MKNLICKILAKISERLAIAFRYYCFNPHLKHKSRDVDYFSWEELVKLKFAVNPLKPKENSVYGHAEALKNLGKDLHGAYIEHGVYFGDEEHLLSPVTDKYKRFFTRINTIYTFSERRKRVVDGQLAAKGLSFVRVISVGPYILGARNFLPPSNLACLKKKLGRVLLVFPMHTTEAVNVRFSDNSFGDFINKVSVRYDTILVCNYYQDLEKGSGLQLKNGKARIVCAGRREDPYFLSRQRDLLELADMVLTNGVGTHIGYAITLNRPCCLFKQSAEFSLCKKGFELEAGCMDGRRSCQEREGFYDLFASFDERITVGQRELVEKWWGKPMQPQGSAR